MPDELALTGSLHPHVDGWGSLPTSEGEEGMLQPHGLGPGGEEQGAQIKAPGCPGAVPGLHCGGCG